jgi:cysteine-rich repeat protein
VEGGVCDARRPQPICVRSRCGDGLVGPGEACDDADDRPDDGCSPDCLTPGPFAPEPDDRDHPYALGAGVVFQIDQPGDADWFRFVLDAPATVGLQVRDAADPLRCSGDPVLDLFRAGDAEPIAGDDDGGAGFCPLLSPIDLPAGAYDVRVRAYDAEAGVTGPNLLLLGTPRVIPAGDACATGDDVARCEDGTYCPAFGERRCAPHVCGDGVVGPGEACDDGNALDDDGCTPDCQPVPIAPGRPCGPERGECVDGTYCPSTGGVDPVCTRHRCGDGVVGPDEPCDDGNGDASDSCTNDCRVRPRAEVSDGGEYFAGFGAGSFDAFDLGLREEAVLRVRLDDGAGACPADALFELYDADGALVASDDDTFDVCPVLEVTLEPGPYRLLVRGFDGQGVARYRLIVELGEVGGPGFGCHGPDDCQPGLSCLLGEAPDARRCGEPPAAPSLRDDGALCDVEGVVADCGDRECWAEGSGDGRCADRSVLAAGDDDGGFAEGGLDLFTLRLDRDGVVDLRVTDAGGNCPGDSTLAVLSAGEIVAANDDAAPGDVCSHVTARLGAGTYDVVVRGYGGGALPAYVLRYAFTPAAGAGEPCPRALPSCAAGLLCATGAVPGTGTCVADALVDEIEPDDLPSADALRLAPGAGVRASLSGADVDVFAVDLPAAATVVVLTGAPDTGACDRDTVLYRIAADAADLDGALAVNDDAPGLGTCSRLVEALPAGRHYYAVTSYDRASDLDYGLRVFLAAREGDPCDPQRLFSCCGADLGCADPDGDGDGVCAP